MALALNIEEPLAVVINAVTEARAYLKEGHPEKALAELEDPLFLRALKDIKILREAVSK